MQLTIASHDLYPDPESGGTGRCVYETARRLVDRGHDVTVVTRRRGDSAARDVVEGITVARYDLSVADTPAPDVLRQLPEAARAVAYACPSDTDVLSLQGPVTGLLADRAVDDLVPRRCTFHSPWPVEYRLRTRQSATRPSRRWLNTRLRHRLESYLLGRADEVSTLSEYMRDCLQRHYAPDAPKMVVPGGVDTSTFTPEAGTDERIQGDPAFLTVRRLSPRMGHDMLLEAFAAVQSHRPDARLYVAGDGPLAEPLRERAAALGIADATTFLGYVSDADLPAVYASADVFVLPTTALEGFGLATLEALASATPVVGTPVGGTVELLDEFQGLPTVPADLLISSVDAEALAAGMRTWAMLETEQRERAGRACRRHATEHFTWDRTVDHLEQRYRALAGPRRTG